MKAKALRQILGFFKKKPVDSKMIKDKTKELLLSKGTMEKYRQGALKSVDINNPSISRASWDKWVSDFNKGITVPPPAVTRNQFNSKISRVKKNTKKFYNSKEFPIWYKNTVNKSIDDVPIKFVNPKYEGLKTDIFPGKYASGMYKGDVNKILISKGGGRDFSLSAGVHEVKHAVQQRMFGSSWGAGMGFMPGPKSAAKKLIDKNLVKPPISGTEKRRMFNYLKDPKEVSARFEEIRLIRNQGGIFPPATNLDIRLSQPFRDLKKIFGSSKKVFDLEKQIWGLAPVGVTGGLLGTALEKEN